MKRLGAPHRVAGGADARDRRGRPRGERDRPLAPARGPRASLNLRGAWLHLLSRRARERRRDRRRRPRPRLRLALGRPGRVDRDRRPRRALGLGAPPRDGGGADGGRARPHRRRPRARRDPRRSGRRVGARPPRLDDHEPARRALLPRVRRRERACAARSFWRAVQTARFARASSASRTRRSRSSPRDFEEHESDAATDLLMVAARNVLGRSDWNCGSSRRERADCSDGTCDRGDWTMRIAVIGGGVAGLGAAHFLARDGHDVTVLERDATPLPATPAEAFAALGPARRAAGAPLARLPRAPPQPAPRPRARPPGCAPRRRRGGAPLRGSSCRRRWRTGARARATRTS